MATKADFTDIFEKLAKIQTNVESKASILDFEKYLTDQLMPIKLELTNKSSIEQLQNISESKANNKEFKLTAKDLFDKINSTQDELKSVKKEVSDTKNTKNIKKTVDSDEFSSGINKFHVKLEELEESIKDLKKHKKIQFEELEKQRKD